METKQNKLLVLEDLRKYIDTHLQEELTPRGVSESIGYATSTLFAFFKDVTGITIHSYIRLRRMQYAAKLMRLGANVNEAYRQSCFQTLYGFIRAFRDTIGVSPYEYASTRGRVLMTEPYLRTRDDCYVVGYCFKALSDLSWMESGAYWQSQQFPEVSAEEYMRIGGTMASLGVWTQCDGDAYHFFGPEVKKVDHVPLPMRPVLIPGGEFLAFRVPAYKHNVELGENVRATWFYAYEQYIPESDYAVDWERVPFEYYLNDDNLIYIPVKKKDASAPDSSEIPHSHSIHPPVLLQGKRGRWDRWGEEES